MPGTWAICTRGKEKCFELGVHLTQVTTIRCGGAFSNVPPAVAFTVEPELYACPVVSKSRRPANVAMKVRDQKPAFATKRDFEE
jgi:hypothetical protein